ncbi:MAG: hypothetical protein ACK55Z_12575, partial [bacterium]
MHRSKAILHVFMCTWVGTFSRYRDGGEQVASAASKTLVANRVSGTPECSEGNSPRIRAARTIEAS